MAEPPAEDQALPPAEIRLKRFLYTGLEIPKYYPGDWAAHKYYVVEDLPALTELINDPEKCLSIVQIVKKAFDDGFYSRIEPLIFALVACLSGGPENLKESVYNTIPSICKQPEHLFLFVKFCRDLEVGYGRGWRRCVNTWYSARPVLQLAEEVAKIRGRYGFRHKDLIKLAHLKPGDDVGRQCIFIYIMEGLKNAEKKFGTKAEAAEILKVLKKVDDFRVCEDPVKGAHMIKTHGLTFDHIPAHFNTKKEIWDELIPNLNTVDLLQCIQRIHNMGFLSVDSSTVEILRKALAKPKGNTRLHPILLYIVICNYKNSGRQMTSEKMKILEEKESRRKSREVIAAINDLTNRQKKIAENQAKGRNSGKSHPPNTIIVEALNELMKVTWQPPLATGARFMITIDMRDHMFKGIQHCEKPSRTVSKAKMKKTKVAKLAAQAALQTDPQPATETPATEPKPVRQSNKDLHKNAECFKCNHVIPAHAAIILALQTLRWEKEVTVAVFTDQGIECVSLGTKNKPLTILEAEAKLNTVNAGKVRMDKPMEWAITNNKKVDVFINILDRVTRSLQETPADIRPGIKRKVASQETACPIAALETYRTKLKLPHTKLVTISLARHNCSLTDGSHQGVFDIVGLDEHTPKVIDAFCRDCFK